MPVTSIYDLANRLLAGRLGAQLLAWRQEGLSYRSIAKRLRDVHDIDVTDETVRRWVRDAEDSPAPGDSAGATPSPAESSCGGEDLQAAVRATA